MLQVEFERESSVLATQARGDDPRQHSWYPARVLFKLRKILAQKLFFVANHRNVDGEQHCDHQHPDRPASRRNGKTRSDQQRSQIQRIPRVRVRSRGCQGLIFAHVSGGRSEEHTSELQSPCNLVCRLLLEKKKKKTNRKMPIIKHKKHKNI